MKKSENSPGCGVHQPEQHTYCGSPRGEEGEKGAERVSEEMMVKKTSQI